MNKIRAKVKDKLPKAYHPLPKAKGGTGWSDEFILKASVYLPLLIPESLIEYAKQLIVLEKDAQHMITKQIGYYDLWPWLSNIRGIGPILGAKIINIVYGRTFPSHLHLWSYAGMDGDNWRSREYSHNLTKLLFNVAECFQRQPELSGGYREIYNERKEYERQKPACSRCIATHSAKLKGKAENKNKSDAEKVILVRDNMEELSAQCTLSHINNKARRYTVKQFLKDMWEEMERLKSATKPDHGVVVAQQVESHDQEEDIAVKRSGE